MGTGLAAAGAMIAAWVILRTYNDGAGEDLVNSAEGED